MITMKKFRVLVPEKNDALLGYTGENLSRRLTIVVDNLGAWSYKLDIRNDAGAANIMDLTAADGVKTQLAGYVADAETAKSGAEAAQTAAEKAAQEAAQAAGGGVTNFNGRTGSVSPQSGDYTAGMVGAIPVDEKGAANGVASLDASGKVPVGQLPAMNYNDAGAAASVQQNLDNHAANGTAHITEEERAAWNAKPDETVGSLIVTFTETNGTATADKTFAEIYAACTAGTPVCCIYRNHRLAVSYCKEGGILFCSTYIFADSYDYVPHWQKFVLIYMKSDDTCSVMTRYATTSPNLIGETDYTTSRARYISLCQDSINASEQFYNGHIAGVYTVS